MDCWQKTASPKAVARAGHAAGDHHHVAGQIAVFRAQPVADPRANARPPELSEARVHKHLCRRVIEVLGF